MLLIKIKGIPNTFSLDVNDMSLFYNLEFNLYGSIHPENITLDDFSTYLHQGSCQDSPELLIA